MKRARGIRRRGTTWIVSGVPRAVQRLATKYGVNLLQVAGTTSFAASRERWLQVHIGCLLESKSEAVTAREAVSLLRFRKRLHELVGYNPTLAGED